MNSLLWLSLMILLSSNPAEEFYNGIDRLSKKLDNKDHFTAKCNYSMSDANGNTISDLNYHYVKEFEFHQLWLQDEIRLHTSEENTVFYIYPAQKRILVNETAPTNELAQFKMAFLEKESFLQKYKSVDYGLVPGSFELVPVNQAFMSSMNFRFLGDDGFKYAYVSSRNGTTYNTEMSFELTDLEPDFYDAKTCKGLMNSIRANNTGQLPKRFQGYTIQFGQP